MIQRIDEFFRFTREERLFASIFTHLLMEQGSNIASFLKLVASKLKEDPTWVSESVDDARVYFEFTFLRDDWKALEKNGEREDYIFRLFSLIPALSGYQRSHFPEEAKAFNEVFMGGSPRVPREDIAMPGMWSVSAIAHRFGDDPQAVRDLCRFKWAFNIKPDIVLVLPGPTAICVEAKLESGEGQYPSSAKECEVFDKLFGIGERRVGQIEEQRFMFSTLLEIPCDFVFLQRDDVDHPDAVSITWHEVFEFLDLTSSTQYVRDLISENRNLRPR